MVGETGQYKTLLLRLLDVRPIEGEPDAITADLSDKEALREAVRGVDAIIHLAGISLEASFDKILKSNIEGTYNLYEAAREEGVERIVFASSNHAVGYTPRPQGDDPLIPIDTPHRPDTFYGLSKSFGEDLAQLYWDKHGLETVSVRIGSCFPEPSSVRMLSIWMSPASVSGWLPSMSVAVIVWLRACTVPLTVWGAPPTPPALPRATIGSPILTEEDFPRGTVGKLAVPVTPWIWRTARSSVGTVPTTVAA